VDKLIVNKKYVLSVSYGDYTNGVGGTDRVIKAHSEMLFHNDISYIYIYPKKCINNRMKISEDRFWCLICDGVSRDIITTDYVCTLLNNLQKKGYQLLAIIVHHFKNVNLHEFSAIVECNNAPILFYLHDYMTICPKAGLITSNDEFCGASFPCKEKCEGCTFFANDNLTRLSDIQQIIDRIRDRLVFIAPSDAAKREWIKCYSEFEKRIRVIYHQCSNEIYLQNSEIINENEPLKIAFIGYQKNLKGWNQWHDAVETVRKISNNIEFYQFGTVKDHHSYIKEVEVDFKKSLSSMIDALRENKIHVAVLWSVWPETYSYTYYESWAANTFVLCNSLSGNICEQVAINRNGVVANAPSQLVSLLQDENRLREMVNQYRIECKNAVPYELIENEELIEVLENDVETVTIKLSHPNKIIDFKLNYYRLLDKLNKVYQSIRKK